MKSKLWTMVIVLAACFYATAASAEMVIGVKAGSLKNEFAGSDPSLNGSIQLAFDIFDIGIADIAVEGEYSTTLTEGEIDLGVGVLDTSFESTGLYAALRTVGPIYAIVRAGFAKTEIDVNGATADD